MKNNEKSKIMKDWGLKWTVLEIELCLLHAQCLNLATCELADLLDLLCFAQWRKSKIVLSSSVTLRAAILTFICNIARNGVTKLSVISNILVIHFLTKTLTTCFLSTGCSLRAKELKNCGLLQSVGYLIQLQNLLLWLRICKHQNLLTISAMLSKILT